MAIETDLPRFARDVIARRPRRGEGLNDWMYEVGLCLHHFRSESEIIALLYVLTAGQPVRPGEIERQVARSKAYAWRPGHSKIAVRSAQRWPEVNREKVEVITRNGVGLHDLWESSPVRLDNSKVHTEIIIDALFPGDPLLCVGKQNWQFATRPRSAWRRHLSSMQLIVPSPMSARIGHTQEGKESQHTLENTGPRRFLVIEFDKGDTDTHAALLWYLAEVCAPLAVALHSGGKSLHGWFFVAEQPEERLHEFMRYAVSLGADRKMWLRSQFCRVPDGTRANGKRQTVYYFNPGVVK